MNRLFIISLQLVILPFSAGSWDLAVALRDRLDLVNLTAEGSMDHIEKVQLEEPLFATALAYDPIRNVMFISDTHFSTLSSIYTLELGGENKETLVIEEPASPDTGRQFPVLGIAYDYTTDTLYWTNGKGGSILYLHPNKTNNNREVLIHQDNKITTGIAVDICGRALFWTNSKSWSGTIEHSNLDGSNHEVLIKNVHSPTDITVDQKSQKLYWCDDSEGIYFKIESSNLDGSSRKVLVHSTNQHPVSIAARPGNIYWSDALSKSIWSIPSSAENAGSSNIIHEYGYTSTRGILSWENSIRLEECTATEVETTRIDQYTNLYDSDVTTTEWISSDLLKQSDKSGTENINSTEEKVNVSINSTKETVNVIGECMNGGKFDNYSRMCMCQPGYSGAQCTLPLCFNYCVHGTCYLNSAGYQQCRCLTGYHGQRCEQDVCENFCLNGGRCSLGEQGEPVCRCEGDYQGRHCELKCSLYCHQGQLFVPVEGGVTPICSCSNRATYEFSSENTSIIQPFMAGIEDRMLPCLDKDIKINPFLIGLGAICSVLCVTILILLRKVCVLKKRPRIKKRIIVSKNVTPLTSRPPPPGDQCEITIENCCNMNICETPCYEPQLRTSKTLSKTEEKKNLLGNMEEGTTCSPCQENLY